jgi:hypothetical protein
MNKAVSESSLALRAELRKLMTSVSRDASFVRSEVQMSDWTIMEGRGDNWWHHAQVIVFAPLYFCS